MRYIGKGIYTVPAASKILGMDAKRIRRWISGYVYHRNTERHLVKPLIKTEFGFDDDVIISFLDLMELLFIKNFIHRGVRIQKIRKAAAAASDLLKTPHPFALRKIFTDGKEIFAKIAKEDNDTSLLDLGNKQFQFEEILEPLLYECIDFDNYDLAEKWWPNGKNGGIVLDPARNMGQPIIDNHNVRTELIYELYRAKHSIDEISDWYELDKIAIEAAIGFEQGLVA
ncbi:MAG: DUF433 domain-containing protein [Treponema sp.]|nr:DUF433 domain-containing protein [Treponema sp.]